MSTLEAFLDAPSVVLLAALNIKQLHSVAKHYKVDVTLRRGVKKHELLDFICACLVDKKVLPEEKLPLECSQGASGLGSEPSLDSETTPSLIVDPQQKSSVLTFRTASRNVKTAT